MRTALSRRQLMRAAAAVVAVRFLPLTGGSAPALAATADPLSYGRFSPVVGSDFAVGASRLRLVEATRRSPQRADRPGLTGEAFSLLFAGGPTKPLADGIYSLAHPTLGPTRLFLVGVDGARSAQRYEAVVDRRG